jgi:hypothetical protein
LAPKNLASLPEDILYLIVSYLTYLDRFRLKMAGNHDIASVLSNLPRPYFKTYVAQLEKCPSKTYPKIGGIEKTLHLACEAGYETLFLKLLSQKLDCQKIEGTLMMSRCLIAAVNCQQQPMVQLVLKGLPSTPYALFLGLRSPGSRRRIMRYRKVHSAEMALEFAAAANRLWAVQTLLKHGAKASSDHGLKGLYQAAERGHQEVVATLCKQIRWNKNCLSKALSGVVRGGHDGIITILLGRGAVISVAYTRALGTKATGTVA